MSTQKRGRACDQCSRIKIKCSLGQHSDDAAPPCERCLRLNKDCVILPPKTQKDRVAELEAQVASLTRLLQAQGIEDPASHDEPDSSRSSPAASTAAKKRRLQTDHNDPRAVDSAVPTPSDHVAAKELSEIAKLDEIVSYDEQALILNRYMTQMLPQFPLVPPVSPSSLDDLRRTRPTLLNAILYGASLGILSLDKQEDISCLLLDQLVSKTSSEGAKTLDSIQAIQLTCLYYRTPRPHRLMTIAVYQLIELAAGLAKDISVSMTDPFSTPYMNVLNGVDVDAVDAWRAWLGCYMLSSSMGTLFRRPNHNIWSTHADNALMSLQYSPVNGARDKWISQYIRAEHLQEEIAAEMEFSDPSVIYNVSDPAMRIKVQTCRNKILSWKLMLPASLKTPALLYWEHVAIAYMHEPLLHTATNKQSFSAPYVVERLSLTDFPAQTVTQDHITALFELVAAAHSIIEIYSGFDTEALVALPGLLFTSRAAYALYILSKLYIAMTAPGNTLGSVFDCELLMLPEYGQKMVEVGTRIRDIDERCSAARILQSSPPLRDWYINYTKALDLPTSLQNTESSQGLGAVASNVMSAEWDFGLPNASMWEGMYPLSDQSANDDLDVLFANPLPPS